MELQEDSKINAVAHNCESYAETYFVGMTKYKINPNGFYALYCKDEKNDVWRESAHVTNTMLRNEK